MKLSMKVVLPLIVILLGALAARAIIAGRPEPPRHSPPEIRPMVEVVSVARSDHQYRVLAKGTVEPRTASALVAEVSARIVSVSNAFVEGGFFERGESLVQLDDRDYRAAVATAEAEVAAARLRLAQQEEEARVAQQEWARFQEQGDPTPLVLRKPQLQEATASLTAAEARLEKSRRDLANTHVRAPYSGRIRSRSVDLGDFVQRGAALARIYSVDYAEIRLPLPDADLRYIDLPLDYRGVDGNSQSRPEVRILGTFAGKRHEWRGIIDRTEGEIDPRSRMIHVVARVKDPYGSQSGMQRPPLSIGMFVDAEILGHVEEDVVVLPRKVLLPNDKVAVVDAEERLRIRPVAVLRATRQEVVIGEGLESGEKVVSSRLDVMIEGMSVRIEESEDAQTATHGSGER